MENFNFGENLRILRNYKNICQDGMVTRLNISQASYSRIKASRNTPDLQLINKLAEILDVKPKALISVSWYSHAVNGDSKKNRRSVATISVVGQIVYEVLLTIAIWDSTSGVVLGAETEAKDTKLLHNEGKFKFLFN